MTLKKNFQLITDLFNAHPDPVVLIDNFFNIQWMNPAFSRWHSSYVTDANQTVNKGGVNLLSFFKSDIAIKDLQDAVQQSKGERLWAQVAGQTIELTVSPIQSDDIHTIIYIKPWQTPNPEHLPSEWTAYASLLHNPFIGIWKLGFEEPIDISNGSREIAEQMFETGIFIECNEAMAKMYGFTDRMSMLGQPVKILYSDREPAIQRIISMINNDFKSEMKDSIEIDQHGRTCAFRSAYYGNIEKGNLDWVWGFQMEISEQYKTELLFQVLYRIAHSVLITPNLSELFKSIQKDLARIVNTTNFYIVTVDEKSDEIIMQYNVDSAGNLNPPSLQSMVAKIISENKARLLTKPDIYKLKEDGIIELEEPYPNSWLGIPLVLGDRVIGALVLQSYDLRIYTDEDLKLLQFVTDQIALAIERKQAAEKSENYRLKLESLIRNVPEAIYTCLDRLGSTTFISDKWERWTGLSTEELIADPMSWSNSIHPDDRDMTVQLFKKACDQGEDYLLHYRVIHRTSGEITYLRDHGIRIKDNKGIHYEGIISDVTDYRLTESRLRASLKEKEILLREVHHRIKNNLQIVISLLNLQGRKSNSKIVNEHLAESQNRVRSMAMIHESLYQSERLTHIDFKGYINNLCKQLCQTYQISQRSVDLKLEVDDIPLSMDFTVPCGLIINELISNSLKHAFPQQWEGKSIITVKLNLIEGNILCLEISDNGQGMNEEFDLAHTDSLGLKLVHILVEDQLGGQLKIYNNNGCKFIMTFPLRENAFVLGFPEND